MSAAVLGFTIITIRFTPLTFITGLFALPVRQFQDNQIISRRGDAQSPTGVNTINYIGKITANMELVSISLTIILMWLAIKHCIGGPVFLRSEPDRKMVTALLATSKNTEANALQGSNTSGRKLWFQSRVHDLEIGKGDRDHVY
ncbi:hypothetical protein LTR84_010424 [Exophiala bonariae]|uniref:ABC transmembrane type-1 domain-containing protein n=1 Tax=Exophiala bonariae TaxID=1690606 RepID=A0AAV9MTF3_9EURO|nr:hypothetical protein LTR84_010424 [Exophiala bonariae]